MLPHSPLQRILSRVVFYSGVTVVAVLMQWVSATRPDTEADDAPETDWQPAEAFYAFPPAE